MKISYALATLLAPLGCNAATARIIGCKSNYDRNFQISAIPAQGDASGFLKYTLCGKNPLLEVKLADGVLKDAHNRSGYIASNFQFQFDDPPQSGALMTEGFSVCNNSFLALGPSTIWYQCLSGHFYNLYDRYWAQQCEPVRLVAMDCRNSPSIFNDEKNVVFPVCQIEDGQVQVHSTPCAVQSALGGGYRPADPTSHQIAPTQHAGTLQDGYGANRTLPTTPIKGTNETQSGEEVMSTYDPHAAASSLGRSALPLALAAMALSMVGLA